MELLKSKKHLISWLWLLSGLIAAPNYAAAEEWIYTIRPGDNLWNVTERHLNSMRYVHQLQQLNKIINPFSIPLGTKIKIPVAWSKQRTDGVTARVVNVQGAALLKRLDIDENIPIELGMQLFAGDEIRSENDSFVTIEFTDQSILRLQDSSFIRIDAMKIFGDFGLVDTFVDLQKGRTENAVPKESEIGTRFRIKTPSAVSSVRGTDFRVGIVSGEESTSSEVLSGLVQVTGDTKEVGIPAGFGTVTATGLPPSAPVKLLPPPDLGNTPSLYEQLPLAITLNPLDGAVAYRAQIASDQKFENLRTEFTTEKLPFRDGDIPDGDYWLRVRGIDANGIEGYDAVIAFTLNARPEPPFIIAPLPDGVADPITREFKWAIQPEASHYIVMVSKDAGFSDLVAKDTQVKTNDFHLTEPLTPGQYFWRIASVSATEGIGPYTDAMPFRMPFPGPAMEETKFDKSQMTFGWRAGGAGQRFHFQLARDREFQKILHDEQTSATQLSVQRPDGGTYYLRTKTIEADGFEGPWGPPQAIDIPYANPYWMLLPFAPLIDLLI
ncbi:FecR domain-containing protein [Nitrosomonas sp.]|uniref:FecR domain-containing protein n=1 Tax=Nitrosomonas sp. TaxID=42353 RepID=UPI001D4D00EA|nr:FecR domain-containing protein [Nitrosomonas sp.]MBX3616767.1 FecR domain-containing protein [Nitrosomonas sp.]